MSSEFPDWEVRQGWTYGRLKMMEQEGMYERAKVLTLENHSSHTGILKVQNNLYINMCMAVEVGSKNRRSPLKQIPYIVYF